MTTPLFQAHKRIVCDGTDFWMPVGPAFFTKEQATEYFQAHYRLEDEDQDTYELRPTAPLTF